MKHYTTAALLVAAMGLSACATPPSEIQPAFVSTAQYSGYSCSALNAEAIRVNRELQAATGRQQQAANNDATMTAVALILFWPAAFFIDGDNNAPQVAQLMGEANAISEVARSRGCVA